MLTKNEIERARKRWFFRIVLTFVLIGIVLAGGETALDYYGFPEVRMELLFPVFGILYLLQIFSYRKIKCTHCGSSIFNQINLLPVGNSQFEI